MAHDPEYCIGNSKSRRHCTNCGMSGHTIGRCKMPITSYGIIAMQPIRDEEAPVASYCWPNFRVLLIRRKDSLSFVDFIRGKYSPDDGQYIENLFKHMTQPEHLMLQTNTFVELWNHVWGNSTKIYNNDFSMSERKYNIIKPLFGHLFSSGTEWNEPEWGFPKGRKNHDESDIDCAMREFHEETNIDQKSFTLTCIDNIPLVELFYGSDNIQYCHKYYIVICDRTVNVDINKSSYHMQQEVGDIGWFSPMDAINKLRKKDMSEKIEVLQKAFELVEKTIL